jgi:pimeloyl-ACP methyl ester carboxylesterase
MARIVRLSLLMVMFLVGLALSPALAYPPTYPPSYDGTQIDGALYEIYLPPPSSWKGDLIVYAHGYVNPYPIVTPPVIPEDQLELKDQSGNTIFIPEQVNKLGYAFAVTSYRKNGLAVRDGVADLVDLVNVFKERTGITPNHVYLAGVSEGALITTLALEQTDVFSGGLALSGPIGDFRSQINYWGDVQVVFDYYFHRYLIWLNDLLPIWTDSSSISAATMAAWEAGWLRDVVAYCIQYDPDATDQLLKVTGAATDPGNPASRAETILDILWYNILATNDGKETLKGQPFDNRFRFYIGSSTDFDLNVSVQRFTANPLSLAEIQQYYQTSGKLNKPLVSMHNTADPITPYWHEPLYLAKVIENDSLTKFISIPVFRYGHVAMTLEEVVAGFDLLVFRVTGQVLPLDSVQSILKESKAVEEFLQLREKIRQLQ